MGILQIVLLLAQIMQGQGYVDCSAIIEEQYIGAFCVNPNTLKWQKRIMEPNGIITINWGKMV